MTIKTSGPISFDSDIKGEFGGSRPHKLSEYFRGKSGGHVPALAGTSSIGSEGGAIKFSQFYGASAYESFTFTIPSYFSNNFASYPGSWTDRQVQAVTFTSTYVNSRITIPACTISIRGDEDEGGPWSSSDYNGSRDPGFVVEWKNASGNWEELNRTRGSGTSTDDNSGMLAVQVPKLEFVVAKTGEFRVNYIMGGYNGGASLNIFSSPNVTATVETA